MDDPENSTSHTRFDLRRETGLSRRDLLRRGAIVGGTLVWVAPAIQTFGATAAYAASPLCTACIAVTTGGTTMHFNLTPTAACCTCIAGAPVNLLSCLGPCGGALGPPQPGPC